MARQTSPPADPPPRPLAAGRPEAATEAELLSLLRRGDRRAANELVGRCYQLIYSALYKLTGGDSELAADLTQDTFARAWRALADFDGRARFSTWLYRIAYNSFLNHIRRPKLLRPFGEGEAELVAAGEVSPSDHALARDAAERLRRAVLRLPDDLRFTITAHYFAERTVPEIAAALGMTQPAIRKRLKRAYRALELLLEEAEP